MPLMIFDCTQFISLKLNVSEHNIRGLLDDFKELGFEITLDEELDSKKVNYLRDYLEDYSVELVNDQFLGCFDIWTEKKDVPAMILDFAKAIEKILSCDYIKRLKIILVDYVSQNKELNHVVEMECTVSEIVDTLYFQSSSCFDAWGNMMIVTVKKA